MCSNDLLVEFESKCSASKLAHPRTEHFIPMLVAAGAAGDDLAAQILYSFPAKYFSLGCYQFGGGEAKSKAKTATAAAAAAAAAK